MEIFNTVCGNCDKPLVHHLGTTCPQGELMDQPDKDQLAELTKGLEDGFVTKDSGERQEFSTGMRRDITKGKSRYDLVYMPMLKRWADLMGRGAEKYGENNWQKAETQEEIDRFKQSAFRHFMQWFNDEAPEEDHAAAILFNISGVEYVKERMKGMDDKIRS